MALCRSCGERPNRRGFASVGDLGEHGILYPVDVGCRDSAGLVEQVTNGAVVALPLCWSKRRILEVPLMVREDGKQR